eukprot:5797526-Prymnesium_polylepis.1
MADGTEWSATGRLGVSLAALSGLQDATFAQMRAVSRLREMMHSASWPPREARDDAGAREGGESGRSEAAGEAGVG